MGPCAAAAPPARTHPVPLEELGGQRVGPVQRQNELHDVAQRQRRHEADHVAAQLQKTAEQQPRPVRQPDDAPQVHSATGARGQALAKRPAAEVSSLRGLLTGLRGVVGNGYVIS